jgi:transcriptional regulator with XRE-family HTH domain
VSDSTQRSEAKRLAALVNDLFETHRHPSGREYKLSEVSAATGDQLTTSWLSLLRKGAIVRPGADKVQLLAQFFGVDASYFTGKQAPQQDEAGTDEDEELRRAISQPLIRQMALRAGRLDEADQARLYELVNQALALGARVREERERGTHSTPTDEGGTTSDSAAGTSDAISDTDARPREDET